MYELTVRIIFINIIALSNPLSNPVFVNGSFTSPRHASMVRITESKSVSIKQT